MKIPRFILYLLLFLATGHALAAYPQKIKQNAPAGNFSPRHPAVTSSPRHLVTANPGRFAALWKQADSLANLGQPRSALEVVEKIYSKAKAENDDPSKIRAIIYRIRLNSEFQENYVPGAITLLKKEADAASVPARQVLQSILAEVYWRYYQNNQYRFRDRTRISGNLPDSLETWDLNTLGQVIAQTYLTSLTQSDSLKKIPIERYEEVVEAEASGDGHTDSLKSEAARFTPTLFDFLAGRALDYFTSEQGGITMPARRFEVDQPWYFSLPGEFALRGREVAPDPTSSASLALRIFFDLDLFHMGDRDRRALIETTLRRLEYVHSKSILPGKDSLYTDALREFEQTELSSPWGTSISFTLATYLNTQGDLYKPFIPGNFQWKKKEALAVCQSAIQRFPGSEGAKNCQVLAGTIRAPHTQLTTESAVVSEKPSLALVTVKNLPKIGLRLVKADPDAFRDKVRNMDRDELFRYIQTLPPTFTWLQEIPDPGDFQNHSAEVALPDVAAGFWLLIVSAEPDPSGAGPVSAYAPFWSTRISYISKRIENGSMGYYLLDRETGHPLKEAVAEVWERSYNYRDRESRENRAGEYRPDDQGYLEIQADGNDQRVMSRYLRIRLGDDLLVTDDVYLYPSREASEREIEQTYFYTDRGIYRPGQTIHFKGILITRTGERSSILPGHKTQVTFRDVNGQKISALDLVTNSFGSVSGTFVAPQGVLLGQMSISNQSGSVAVSVEEYKRPTFDVTANPVEGNYRLGSAVTLTGKAKAYSGNPVDGARVSYRVVRNARFPFWDWGWRWPMPASPEAEITSGTTVTGSDGAFTITFTAVPDLGIDPGTLPVFDFTVYADATSPDGETQSMQQGISAGYRSLLIDASVPETVNLAADTLAKVTTRNLSGRHTPAVVTLTLQRLRQPDRIFLKRMWERPDLHLFTQEEFHSRFPYDVYDNEDNPESWPVQETLPVLTINTATDSILRLTALPGGAQITPGTWRLVMKSSDPFGETVEVKRYLTVFSPVSREIPVNAAGWMYALKNEGEPGTSARFLLGTKEDDVRVLYEIRKNEAVLSREWLRISDRVMALDIPIREEYRGNVSVNFVFVKHNRSFQYSSLVTVPHVDKKLDIKVESFRDRLEPGAAEQWTLRIGRPGGKPAKAEFLASMYDLSLDVFRPNTWTFSLLRRYSGVSPWSADDAFSTVQGQFQSPGDLSDRYRFHPWLKLNWFGAGNFMGGGNIRYMRGMMANGGRMEMDNAVAYSVLPEASAGKGESKAIPPAPSIRAQETRDGTVEAVVRKPAPVPIPQVRRDFRETAFFFPDLETDSAGVTTLRFTAPESLTRWKFMGLAHTRELDYGLIEKELVTRKDLMVYPNAPRFVRQGDTVIFSARIANLSGGDLSGSAVLELKDGITGKDKREMILADERTGGPEKRFEAKNDLSTVVSWKLAIPAENDLSLLQFRITATAGSFSDGEERSIPVLTNRMMVTESLPLPVRGQGTTTFRFGKLAETGGEGASSSRKNYRLTLEFTSNPAWYAIQALPSLNEKTFENADALFAAWWSNSLAAHIANSNPKIQAVFDAWKNLTPDALLSNLSKNQDLKSALLQETPWVVEANSETGRRQRLGLYFDRDNLAANLASNFRKLEKLQTSGGGWCWFAGMPENRYISQRIVTGIGRLHHLGVHVLTDDAVTRRMMVKAIRYLDGELVRDYEDLKKYHPGNLADNHLGGTQAGYLYARSLLAGVPGFSLDDAEPKAREAFDYYRKQAEKYWLKQDRSGQGMIALALHRLGNREVPALILKSLSEKALHSGEMGMYWAGDDGYSGYQVPIETQALMVEAFDEINGDRESVDEMKIWLLKQKQTQDWRNDRATLEACYALVLRGTDLLSQDPGVTIMLGKQKIDPRDLPDIRQEAGTGYFRISWQGTEITPDMATSP